MAIISIGKIDKKLIPMVVGCIFCFLNRLLNQYDGTLLFKNPIMTNISISSSKLFTIVPFLISHKFYKNDVQAINKIKTLQNKYTTEKEKVTKGKWPYLFFSAMVFFVNQFLYVLTIKIKTNTSILNILITSIFYYLIFKAKLFRHHYFSCALIIITGLSIDLILENLQYDLSNNLPLFFVRILRELFYSLSSVIDKYIMERKFVSVYELLLSNGVIILIILIIFAVFDYNFFGIDNYSEYFSNFNFKELLVIFGVLITQFGLNLCILITNKNNSPCHIFIIFISGQLALYVDFSGISLIVLFFLIFILFLSLIFNEIIEINFWGLSYNTKNNIIKRAIVEENMIITRKDTNDNTVDAGQYEINMVSCHNEEDEEKVEQTNI